jgi:quercetin dioxygenase-like cupin family protein
MADLKRYVVGLNEQGKSAVVLTGVPNQQEKKGFFWRATLWKTKETPVDNTVGGDRSLEGGAARSPFANGMLVRVLEFWPDQDPETQAREMAELNKLVGQKHEATEADAQRSHTMHTTDTLDVINVVRGEIYLVLEDGEVLLKPTDTVIIQGVKHGWSNRGSAPCLLLGSMIDALPRAES